MLFPRLTCRLERGLVLLLHLIDSSLRATEERVMTILEGVNERMIDLATTHRQDVEEFYVCHQDAQDDQAELRAYISTLQRERRYFLSMSLSYKGRSQAIEARIKTLEAQKMTPKKTATTMTDVAIK
nr:hypothetical protein [Tanacetum cinerariifolium]